MTPLPCWKLVSRTYCSKCPAYFDPAAKDLKVSLVTFLWMKGSNSGNMAGKLQKLSKMFRLKASQA